MHGAEPGGAGLGGCVRCGAVRCGAVRCGAVRCGAVRCGAVRCGAVRCGAASHRSLTSHSPKPERRSSICPVRFEHEAWPSLGSSARKSLCTPGVGQPESATRLSAARPKRACARLHMDTCTCTCTCQCTCACACACACHVLCIMHCAWGMQPYRSQRGCSLWRVGLQPGCSLGCRRAPGSSVTMARLTVTVTVL
jgi:hypothetical protein